MNEYDFIRLYEKYNININKLSDEEKFCLMTRYHEDLLLAHDHYKDKLYMTALKTAIENLM